MAWDVTKIPKTKNWSLADAKGTWVKNTKLEIIKSRSGKGFLSSLFTNPIPESRIAAKPAVEQRVSLMSSFWGDFEKIKSNVKENRQSINELVTNQNDVRDTQREILGRLEKLEKNRDLDKFTNLSKKIKTLEGQFKILNKYIKSSKEISKR